MLKSCFSLALTFGHVGTSSNAWSVCLNRSWIPFLEYFNIYDSRENAFPTPGLVSDLIPYSEINGKQLGIFEQIYLFYLDSTDFPIYLSLCVCCHIGLVCEDVEGHLCALLLDVLDKEGDLHGAPDLHSTHYSYSTQCSTQPHLFPDHAHPGLVTHEAVHGHAVLDDQGRDGDEGQH